MKLSSVLKTKKLFIFDLDGTVTDTEPLHRLSYDSVLRDICGQGMEHEEFLENYVGHSETEIYGLLKKNRGIDFDDSEFFRRRIYALFQLVDKTGLTTAPFYRRLCDEYPKSRFIALTSQREDVLRRFRQRVDYGKITEFISVADKPIGKKDILTDTEKYFSIPASECVLFEDYSPTLSAAKLSGVCAVAVKHSLNSPNPESYDYIIDIQSQQIDF